MDTLPGSQAEARAPRTAPVGFIGLGMMGRPMAARLLATGHALQVADQAQAALQALAAAAPADNPPRLAAGPADVAAECDIVVLMLPDSRVVATVMQDLLPAARPGLLVVDMGSSLPAETRRWAGLLAAKGAAMIDAPVSGSVPKATDGTLAIMVGGEAAAIAQARPVLEHLGATLIPTGPVGSAHAMKALNNYVYAAGLLAASEALQMAQALGLDGAILTDVMNASSGRNIATETKLKQFMLSGSFNGGFQLGLMRKDLETAGAIAEESGIAAEELQTCRRLWTAAVQARGPKVDNTEILRHLRGEKAA
jgi:3-hydroxyisobutyrate dehydrogenase